MRSGKGFVVVLCCCERGTERAREGLHSAESRC